MKITLVIGPYNPIPLALGGAVERVLSTLAPYFAARGHDVTIISRRFGEFANDEIKDGIRYIRVPSFDAPTSRFLYRFYDYVYSRRVAKMLPPSDVTVTSSPFLPLALPLDRAGHIYIHVARFPKGQMWLYRMASRIQAVSEAVAEEIKRQSPSVQDRVASIPNPLSGPLATLAPPDRAPRSKTLLFVGRLAREKGVHLLVEAFARAANGPLAGYRLRIVGPHEIREQGDGEPYLAELKSMAAPVRDRVIFDGPVFDPQALRDIYLESDIFAYPSVAERGEAFGVAPLEAMAARCRVVVSSLACFREYVQAGSNALVFDHRGSDPAGALADTLSTLVHDTDTERMRDAAARTASRFQPPHIADLYLQDFDRVVRGEAPGLRLALP